MVSKSPTIDILPMKSKENPADKVRDILRKDLCTPEDECVENVVKFRKNTHQNSLYQQLQKRFWSKDARIGGNVESGNYVV